MEDKMWRGGGKLLPYKGRMPTVGREVFLADGVLLIGDTVLEDQVSVWFGTVMRGDVDSIRIGARTNIQDLSMCHVTAGSFPLNVGSDTTVGHNSILHGCTIGDRVLIGMGSTLLDGAVIEDDVLLGAGSLVPPGARIPSGFLALGRPARVRRELTAADRAEIMGSAAHYMQVAKNYP